MEKNPCACAPTFSLRRNLTIARALGHFFVENGHLPYAVKEIGRPRHPTPQRIWNTAEQKKKTKEKERKPKERTETIEELIICIYGTLKNNICD
jgi:hypothetical protein